MTNNIVHQLYIRKINSDRTISSRKRQLLASSLTQSFKDKEAGIKPKKNEKKKALIICLTTAFAEGKDCRLPNKESCLLRHVFPSNCLEGGGTVESNSGVSGGALLLIFLKRKLFVKTDHKYKRYINDIFVDMYMYRHQLGVKLRNYALYIGFLFRTFAFANLNVGNASRFAKILRER